MFSISLNHCFRENIILGCSYLSVFKDEAVLSPFGKSVVDSQLPAYNAKFHVSTCIEGRGKFPDSLEGRIEGADFQAVG
jgi:hypothetical protein